MATTPAASGFSPITTSVGVRQSRPEIDEKIHPDYEIQFADWEMLGDIYAGERSVKARFTQYLYKTELEERDSRTTGRNEKSRYEQRLERSPFINGVERLTRYAMSHLFRENPILPLEEKLPLIIKPLLSNVDMLGTTFEQFIKNIAAQAYVMGHYFILVDMPDTRESVGSLADQNRANPRPYFVAVDPRDILNWSIIRKEDGGYELEWVVHRISEFISTGPFDEHEHNVSYKVWYKDRWELYESTVENNQNSITLADEGVNPLGEVPIVPMYSNLIRPMLSNPPLLEAAYLNISHYNQYSMFVNGMMFHLNPLLVFSGVTKEALVERGADYSVFLPQHGKAEYVEYSGDSLAVAKSAVDQLSTEVVEAGLRNTSFLGANTSAEARRLARSDFNSYHQNVAHNYDLSLTQAFKLAGRWVGEELTDEQAYIKINRDFDVVTIDAAMAQFLLTARGQGEISRKRFLTELERGEVMQKGIDLAQEIKDAESDGPSLLGLTEAQINADRRSGTGSNAAGRQPPSGGGAGQNPNMV